MNYTLGVDGCRAGWFAARLMESGEFHFWVYPRVSELLSDHPNASILIDIPIGLVETAGSRLCDVEARRLLGGKRASSVFTAPCRQATRAPDHPSGSAVNAAITGKKLSAQAWGIVPKIVEVDDALVNPTHRGRLMEVHPELLFWALNGRRAMVHRKAKSEGVAERLSVLRRFIPSVEDSYGAALARWPRSSVGRDDVIDAFAAAVTGHFGAGSLSSVPREIAHDARGLPMRMVIWEPGQNSSEDVFRLRIPGAVLARYADRYDESTDAPIERFLHSPAPTRVLSRRDLLELVRWKSPRPVRLAEENSEEFVRAVTAACLQTTNERLRIEGLQLLKGVSWPTASVILHVCLQADYPILDFRALWTLGVNRPPDPYGFEFWMKYVDFFRELTRETQLPARVLDRALWQYSKENQ